MIIDLKITYRYLKKELLFQENMYIMSWNRLEMVIFQIKLINKKEKGKTQN